MSDKQCHVTAISILIVTVFLCFSNIVGAGFVSDDFVLVNRVASEGYYSSWGGENGTAFFRPATTLSYLFDYSIWGINSTGFHITNLFWHCLAGIAVFLLFRVMMYRVSFRKPCLYGLLTGVLFLSLSSHSESVSWISGRADIIATALSLLSVFFYYRQLNNPSIFQATLALFLFFAGLMAKESVIITPLLWGIFLIYSAAKSRENLRRNLRLLLICLLITGVYLALRIIPGNGFFSNLRSGGFLDISGVNIPENLIRYTFRVFIPPLPVSLRQVVLSFPLLVPITLLLLLVPFGIALHRKATGKQKRILLLLIGCFFVSLLPVLSMKVSLFDTQSERFLYLPGVFAAGFLTVATVSLFKESRTSLVILVVLIFVQGIFLHRSNGNWRQAGRLCSSIVQSVSEYDADSILILAIPDSFRGAYVFRNGLNEAVTMFTGRESNYIVYCRISSYGDSLFLDNGNRINPYETQRTVISCVNGRMRTIQ
ncbi:MAG: hypothetical protein GQ565_08335 [Candidatus Aegiribacteria sp.]|nr:hypothetical protein [Candidatus Aegiribacteria sp.]